MLAFDPDSKLRWLFCMTHPDDEIAICAWVKRLTSVGSEVWISWTHTNPVRQREAQRAAFKLGVPKERLVFLEATDGSVIHEMATLLPRFQTLMERVKPDRVVCGAFEQGHLDHDATNVLVSRSFDGPIFEVPFYYSYLTKLPRVNRFSDPRGEEIIQLSDLEREFKINYAQSFPSQAIWRNMIFAEAAARLNGDGSLMKSERMKLQKPTNYAHPNHSGELADKILESPKWATWTNAYQQFLAKMGE